MTKTRYVILACFEHEMSDWHARHEMSVDMIVCQKHDICWYVQMRKTSYVELTNSFVYLIKYIKNCAVCRHCNA